MSKNRLSILAAFILMTTMVIFGLLYIYATESVATQNEILLLSGGLPVAGGHFGDLYFAFFVMFFGFCLLMLHKLGKDHIAAVEAEMKRVASRDGSKD